MHFVYQDEVAVFSWLFATKENSELSYMRKLRVLSLSSTFLSIVDLKTAQLGRRAA